MTAKSEAEVEVEETTKESNVDIQNPPGFDSKVDYKGQVLQYYGPTAKDAVKISFREEGKQFVGVVVLVEEDKTFESEPQSQGRKAERLAAFKAKQYLAGDV